MNNLLPLAFALLVLGPLAAAAAAEKPNVILLITDDQGYGDLGCHGNAMIRTPNLDRLHGQSAGFTDFHVDPICSPTRAALLTGRYSTRTGVWHTVMVMRIKTVFWREDSCRPDATCRRSLCDTCMDWHAP